MLEIINKNSKTSPERIKSMLSENNAFCTLCRRYLKIRYGSDLSWHLQMMMLDSRIVSVLQESYSRQEKSELFENSNKSFPQFLYWLNSFSNSKYRSEQWLHVIF